MKNLKKYNESIKDFLKPKSVEDIKKISDKLSLIENLQKGSEIGSLYMVKKAIDRGINPSMDDNRAIRMACKFGHYDIVKFLLKDERVNPSDDLGSGFSWACRNGHIEIVKLLLTDDRIYNNIYLKDNAINWAFMTNQIDIIKLILKDKRVEKIIKDERIKKILLEDFQRNQMNESIKDYLKPKSNNDIIKSLINLPVHQMVELILKYDIDINENKEIMDRIESFSSDYQVYVGCTLGSLSLIEKNIKNIEDIEQKYEYFLRSVSNKNRYEILNYFVRLILDGKQYKNITHRLFKSLRNIDEPISFTNEQKQKINNILGIKSLEDKFHRFIIYDSFQSLMYCDLILGYNNIDRYCFINLEKYILCFRLGQDERSQKRVIVDDEFYVISDFESLLKFIDDFKIKDQIKKLIKESVKHFLKPKTEEDIISKLEGLSPYKKFYRGCQHGIMTAVKQAIEEGINPTIENNVGIRMASSKGYTDIVKYLLSFNRIIPPHVAIEDAARNNHAEILELLLNDKKNDFDPTDFGYYIINYCATHKKYDSLKVLLNNELVRKKWHKRLDIYEKQLKEYEKNR